MVFDKNWFLQHQKILLWLLNTPIIKIWFRWVLRIRKEDLNINKKINAIGVNFFTYDVKQKGKKIYAKTSFRSNEKYARRLWFAFEPIWWLFHSWDMITKPFPSLNLGFDTLPTKYSTPGSTVSGRTQRSTVGETFATIRAGAGNSQAYDGGSSGIRLSLVASTTSNQYYDLYRGIFLFDTSALDDLATITQGVIGLYGFSSKSNALGSFEVDIVSSAPASNTAIVGSTDHATIGTTPFSSIAYASLLDSQYNSFTLNASGIANISKTGISKFGARLNWDTDNSFGGTWGSGLSSFFYAADGGTASTTSDPKIDIEYTVANNRKNLLLLGVG